MMNRIAELRKAAGLSQTDLAKELGIAQNTLSQYETENRSPTKRIIKSLSSIFGVSENYLLGYPEPKLETNYTPDISDINLSNATIIHQYTSINDVNFRLRLGWKLLHIGTKSAFYEGGEGYSDIVYTVGWFGDPNDTLQNELPEDGDERSSGTGYGWDGI